ncbi:MAG: UDP-N-acetylmuramoyl-L-alanyl-D-glutamate--2,6-diaminopimelate ligase [Candidatus Paceibacterota bacterium]|jgi:UDP-N-acetylmuramoyl-L-alanyl-D-glutamate--2,6-diaminopimelate ligase
MKKLIKNLKIKRRAIATLAAMHFYGNPSSKLKIVGVTGTNGKTTTATLLYKIATELGYKTGLISTVENIIGTEKRHSTHTTPGPIPLNKLLSEMVDKGCEYVFMEVSSHAMDQKRVAGVNFVGGIFTNLTHDHLDYHKSFENYFGAKKKFFKALSLNAFALSNIDDEYGKRILEKIRAKKYSYGFKNKADFNERLDSKLIGEFNAYNILAIYGAAVLLGFDKEKVKEIIKNLESVAGRFESIKSINNTTGIVDFAHTPDALENVLKTIQKMKNGNQKIITVFGCGGDRDISKRQIMTKIVYENSDIIIPTADNSRNEKIEDIFLDMKKGLPDKVLKEVLFIADRGEAIKKACSLALAGDYILLAGKGHEKYQEILGVKVPFNDMEELKKNLI